LFCSLFPLFGLIRWCSWVCHFNCKSFIVIPFSAIYCAYKFVSSKMSHDHHDMNHDDMNHAHMNHGDHNMDPIPTLNTVAPNSQMPLFNNNFTSLVPAENIGGHDHSGHGGHDAGGHDMMSMKMYFHFGYDEKYVLFTWWSITSVGGLIGSMIGIFLLAMLYEGLKVLREYLLHRSMRLDESGMSRQSGSSASSNGLRVPLAGEADSVQDSQNVVVIKSFFRPNPFSCSHTIQTTLHMLQMIISYLLMLIFMTYNLWLCLAVVLGAGAGYFVFAWRKRTIIDVNKHCH